MYNNALKYMQTDRKRYRQRVCDFHIHNPIRSDPRYINAKNRATQMLIENPPTQDITQQARHGSHHYMNRYSRKTNNQLVATKTVADTDPHPHFHLPPPPPPSPGPNAASTAILNTIEDEDVQTSSTKETEIISPTTTDVDEDYSDPSTEIPTVATKRTTRSKKVTMATSPLY